MKFLLWAAIGFVVVLWLLHSKKMQMGLSGANQKTEVKGREAENMVSCAQCGLHFPASEAVTDRSGTAFCSDEHRRRHTG